MKLGAEWTDDCQGKKDFDGDILSISTRYWPAGGGFSAIIPGRGWVDNPCPDVKPSAKCSLILRHKDDYITLASKEFEGESFDAIKGQVEEYAQAEFSKLVDLLKLHYGDEEKE